jgi:HSP20 family molecular chaperone IbpA
VAASPRENRGKFFISPFINSAFGYEFRGEIKNLQSASSRSARQKLYKVEVNRKSNISKVNGVDMSDFAPKSFWDVPSILREGVDFFDRSISGITVSEDDAHVYVEAQVPGVPSKDIQVEFEDGFLTIHAEVKAEETKKKYYRKSQNVFSYALRVPGKIDTKHDIQASCKDGILKVTFKKTEGKPSGKKIPVKEE